MQNDANSSGTLFLAVNEEEKKQLSLLLEKRKQYRDHGPAHSANDPKLSAGVWAPIETATRENDLQETNLKIDGVSHVGGITEGQRVLREAPIKVDQEVDRAGTMLSPSTLDVRGAIDEIQSLRPASSTVARRCNAYAIVAVCYSFRYLPSLSEKTKEVAEGLFNALVDSHYGRFSRRGSKLLLNPSVIEFQETMEELREACKSDVDASFFLCISSHGARVISGVNEGSYALFNETRLSSEDELLLTAIHERELVKMIHAIPCRNRLIALELCQAQQARDKPKGEADNIRNCIHEDFSAQFYAQLIALEQAEVQSQSVRKGVAQTTTREYNTIVLDSLRTKMEAPVRDIENNVSNFLHRLSDAFHGGAIDNRLEDEPEDPRRAYLVKEICSYIVRSVVSDATRQNNIVKAEYKKQVRTKYELAAAFQDITHTPQIYGIDKSADFFLGDIPSAPTISPSKPFFEASTLASITIAWEAFTGFPPTTSPETPIILGYHVQYRNCGRASETWKRASGFQVLSYESAARAKQPPPIRLTVYGLISDTAYCFRIRARSPGGWGPFSEPTNAMFRTRSYASVHSQFETVRLASEHHGAQGVVALMRKHGSNSELLRLGIESLARMVWKGGPTVDKTRRLIPGLDTPVVTLVLQAMRSFRRNFQLQRQACILLGRLAESPGGAWRAILLGFEDPRCIKLLQDVADRFASVDPETKEAACWAIRCIRTGQ